MAELTVTVCHEAIVNLLSQSPGDAGCVSYSFRQDIQTGEPCRHATRAALSRSLPAVYIWSVPAHLCQPCSHALLAPLLAAVCKCRVPLQLGRHLSCRWWRKQHRRRSGTGRLGSEQVSWQCPIWCGGGRLGCDVVSNVWLSVQVVKLCGGKLLCHCIIVVGVGVYTVRNT